MRLGVQSTMAQRAYWLPCCPFEAASLYSLYPYQYIEVLDSITKQPSTYAPFWRGEGKMETYLYHFSVLKHTYSSRMELVFGTLWWRERLKRLACCHEADIMVELLLLLDGVVRQCVGDCALNLRPRMAGHMSGYPYSMKLSVGWNFCPRH